MSQTKRELGLRVKLPFALMGLLALTLAGFGAAASRALASRDAQPARGGLSPQAIHLTHAPLPLSFVQNGGQAPKGVDYLANGAGWSLGLSQDGVQLALGGRHSDSVLRVATPNGRLRSPVAEQRLPGRVDYFVGTDRGRWVTRARMFARVVYRNVWPGIDLAFHGHNGVLEYDFDLAPGADPSRVALRFAGARALTPDGRGGVVISWSGGKVRIAAPRAVQGRRAVVSRLVVSGDSIRLSLGAYDHNMALVVDPALVYMTDLGGGFAAANGIAADASGNAYVTGNTGTQGQGGRAFVTKLSPTGSVVYSAFLGGTSSVKNFDIAVDAEGDAYVTGQASSTGFPATTGAYQASFGGGSSDAFVAKLNASGGLVYATYLGGSGADLGNSIAVDGSGDAYVTGDTGSSNFPTSPGAYQRSGTGGFVAKLNPTGSALVYSTYLNGGDVRAIAVDSVGSAYVTGDASGSLSTTPGAYQATFGGGNFDAFVVKLNPGGSGLVYSTHLGGSSDEIGAGIAVDPSGEAFVSGWTTSTNFPTTRGAFQRRYAGSGDDGFVTKLSATGRALVYSTYLGGRGGNSAGGIAVDAVGDAYVTGETTSSRFPTTPGAYQTSNKAGGGQSTAFVTKLSPNGGALLYSTYLPQDIGGKIAVDPNGNAYVADVTTTDAFGVKLALAGDVAWGLWISPHIARRVGGRPARLRISYQLSARARLTIRLLRMLPGRARKLIHIRGAFIVSGHRGTNHSTFKGSIGGRELTPGHYELTATPAADGHAGTPLTTTLTIAS